MALPVPNLDDRRFQDLVDDAKRLVQRRCPEWTDHNVSDPGVTLIETFAVHDRPAPVPAQPGTGPQLHQVPGADRRAAVPADRGHDQGHVLAVGAPGDRRWPCPAVSRWPPRGRRPGLGRSPSPRPRCSTSCRARCRHRSIVAGGTWRNHTDALTARTVLLLSRRSRCPARYCSSACPRPCLAAPSACASTAPSRASASTPTGPRCLGSVRRGVVGDLRGRPGHHRWAQPSRRRRAARPAHPRHVARAPAAGRLAAGPADGPGGGPAVLQQLASDQGSGGAHHRRDHRRRPGRGGRGRSDGSLGRRSRPALRGGPPASGPFGEPIILEVSNEEEGWQEWTEVRTSPRAGPRTATSCSTRWPARCCWARPCACRTGARATMERCRPRVQWCASVVTTRAVAARAT